MSHYPPEPSDFDVGAMALASYLYNTSAVQFVRDVYGDAVHPSYAAEKMDVWAKSQARAIGYLDLYHRSRLLRAVRLAHEAPVRDMMRAEARADDIQENR